MNKHSVVSIVKKECCVYPTKDSNFRPSEKYPEYIFDELSNIKNDVYDAVRQSLALLGLDEEHFGTSNWNPLGRYIRPGMTVLIKPNLVLDYNQNASGGTDCLYTQPSVVAPVIDYVLLALKNNGRVIIGDAPMQECKFDKLVHESGYEDLLNFYNGKGCNIDIIDFRELKSVVKNGVNHSAINDKASGTIIDLGKHSEFDRLDDETLSKLRITNYDPRVLKQHHCKGKHEYYISNYILNADVIINMPKPKAHRKAGITVSLKNFVGANTRKEFLPHHIQGSKSESGDEYDRRGIVQSLRSRLMDIRNIHSAEENYLKARFYLYGIHCCTGLLAILHKKYKEGSWYGNNTISRTISDINKIIYYADKTGIMQEEQTRSVIIIADMIVCGEKEGPVAPSPKNVGIIAAGTNPVCFDETICTLMGFDKDKVPAIITARGVKECYVLVDENCTPIIRSNDKSYDEKMLDTLDSSAFLGFVPTEGWKGHIEK